MWCGLAKPSVSEHWCHQRLLLSVRAGSRSHGLGTADSDEDSRGVCVPPPRYLYGLSHFEQWESEGGDHVVYSLQKFVRLALEGNPNIIEAFYVEPKDRLVTHALAEPLLASRDRFLSRKVGVKFGRYAIHQLQKIERHYGWLTQKPPSKPEPWDFGATAGENSPKFPDTASERAFRGAVKHHRAYQEWRQNRNPKRAALEEQYGYDTKHAMHLCRLLKMGIEILATGQVLVHRPDAEWLRSIRNGALSYEALLQWVKSAEKQLAQAEQTSALPPEPDYQWAEGLVVDITETFLKTHPL
jgi:predicted nucleotidyltransferase